MKKCSVGGAVLGGGGRGVVVVVVVVVVKIVGVYHREDMKSIKKFIPEMA